jgi:hypothetical protein
MQTSPIQNGLTLPTLNSTSFPYRDHKGRESIVITSGDLEPATKTSIRV